MEHSEQYDPFWKSEEDKLAEEQRKQACEEYEKKVREQKGLEDPNQDEKLDSVLEAYDKAKEQIDRLDQEEEDLPDLEQPS